MEPKFNLNRPKISDEEIEKGKDFDKLILQYRKMCTSQTYVKPRFPHLKKMVYTSVILSVVMAGTITFNNLKNENSYTSIPNNLSSISLKEKNKKPISKKTELPYHTHKIMADETNSIQHSISCLLYVPNNIFIKKNGVEVNGEVELHFMETDNNSDFLVAGLWGMNNNQKKNELEIAHIMNINGFKNGEAIYIKPGKTVEIHYNSSNKDKDHNLYELNTIKAEWKFKGKVNTIPIINKEDRIKNEQKAINTDTYKTKDIEKKILHLETIKDSLINNANLKIRNLTIPILPDEPQLAKNARKKFKLDVNYNDFPELKKFRGCVFEVGEENLNYTEEFNNIEWQEAFITAGPVPGKNYLLNLKQNKRKETLIVYPVLEGNNLKIALSEYENKLKEYKTSTIQYKLEEHKIKLGLQGAIDRINGEQSALKLNILNKQKDKSEYIDSLLLNNKTSQSLKRVLRLNRFGIYAIGKSNK